MASLNWKKADALFPMICDCAHGIAGISAATATTADSEYQDPQILSQANLESEDEEDGNSGVDEEHHDNGISTNLKEEDGNSDVSDSEDQADDEKCGSDSQASDDGSNDSDDGKNYYNNH